MREILSLCPLLKIINFKKKTRKAFVTFTCSFLIDSFLSFIFFKKFYHWRNEVTFVVDFSIDIYVKVMDETRQKNVTQYSHTINVHIVFALSKATTAERWRHFFLLDSDSNSSHEINNSSA